MLRLRRPTLLALTALFTVGSAAFGITSGLAIGCRASPGDQAAILAAEDAVCIAAGLARDDLANASEALAAALAATCPHLRSDDAGPGPAALAVARAWRDRAPEARARWTAWAIAEGHDAAVAAALAPMPPPCLRPGPAAGDR